MFENLSIKVVIETVANVVKLHVFASMSGIEDFLIKGAGTRKMFDLSDPTMRRVAVTIPVTNWIRHY